MSGGVDSSVAAALLVEQGYDVVGATMKLFCYGDSVPDRPCCSLDSITDARLVAHKLGIPHYVLNFEDRFGRDVIANFVAEYASGRTPIPCVRCNSFTKFRDFLYHADALDCAYVATGHYAIAHDGALFRGRDPRKDQSYFLWGIDRSVVARMLTPVGDLTKRETRAVARRLGLVTAEKVESVEICFVPDDDYVGVLERHLPADAPALTPGPLVTAGGDVVGEHAGFARYTIGQRRGLPGGFREPMYVVAIRPETREVVIGSGDEPFGYSVTLAELNCLRSPPRRDRAPRHGPIAAVRGTLQSVPGTPARQRSVLTPEESHASTSPLSSTVPRGRRRAARCRLRRQPTPTEETGRPARDRRQRPGAGYELHLPAVPELLVRHDVCADCREPDGGAAAAAARRPAHARDPSRSLARREPARRHGAARCARPIERCHRRVDLPARGRVGHDVYVERDDLPVRGKRPGGGARRAVERCAVHLVRARPGRPTDRDTAHRLRRPHGREQWQYPDAARARGGHDDRSAGHLPRLRRQCDGGGQHRQRSRGRLHHRWDRAVGLQRRHRRNQWQCHLRHPIRCECRGRARPPENDSHGPRPEHLAARQWFRRWRR